MRSLSFFLACLPAVLPLAAEAQVTHQVNQVGTSFSPANLTIQAGDKVRWVWSFGFHTVTSGASSVAPDVGSLFDSPLNEFSPTFEFTFTQPGVVPYFCRPHESVAMKGTITVEDLTSAPPASRANLLVHGVDPNPFNPSTQIEFSLEEPGTVSVSVHDARGRFVREIVTAAPMDAGERSVEWDGLDDSGTAVASGVYRFTVRTGDETRTVSGVLLR